MTEREQDQAGDRDDEATAEQDDESPEEFAEDIESDPSRNPDDPGLDALRGG
jgi:hypothetical protein